MRVFGNLNNRIMESSKQPVPAIGMGCTILMWSDRHAATIIGIGRKGRMQSVRIQRDKAIRTDKNGMSECQSYTFEPNKESEQETFTLRRNGAWVKDGSKAKDGTRIMIGHRSEYHDYSF